MLIRERFVRIGLVRRKVYFDEALRIAELL